MTPRATFETELRHHCRRCRLKLKEPVENPRSAFCCRKCYKYFFEKRCLVCEKKMERTAGHQKLCRSVACRRGYRDIIAHQIEGKFGAKPQCSSDGGSPSANPIKIGVCGPEKIDRPWRQVANPTLSPVEMGLATLPIDTGTASRIDRINRDYWREAGAPALIQRHHAPVNVVGGHKFADAPLIDISSGAGPITGDIPRPPQSPPPVPAYGDVLAIPDFSAANQTICGQHQPSQK
jgi:hypothetical protein